MTQSFDELYSPKAMTLDELFAAIRPPPLKPVVYDPPAPFSAERLWTGIYPTPFAPLNYPDAPSFAGYAAAPSGAPADSNPPGMNPSRFMNAMFSGTSSALRPQNIAAQRQVPPTSQPRIYGNALDPRNPGRPLTDDQISSIIFNEIRSLSGPGIDDARYNKAMVILHNNLNLHTLPKMASPKASVPPSEQSTYDSILSAAKRARTDFLNGINPTNGATNFNLRKDNSVAPFLNFPLRTQVGPLNNSFPTRELPAKGIYANTYGR